MSPTREKFPLSPKKITKKTLDSISVIILMLFGFLFIFTFVMLSVFEKPPEEIRSILFQFFFAIALIDIIIIIISLILARVYQTWYFAVYYYELGDDYIIIRKGPITPSEITIPYERLQDVYMDQDLLDRMFGLYDVHISSATVSSGMTAHIDGLEVEAAIGLRDSLLEIMKQKKS